MERNYEGRPAVKAPIAAAKFPGKCPTCGRDAVSQGGVLGKDGKALVADPKTGKYSGTDIHGNVYDDKGVHPVNVDKDGNALVKNATGEWVKPE
jgi:hypothetical protein